MEGEDGMTTIKMLDGSRYELNSDILHEPNDRWLVIIDGNKKVYLNSGCISSIEFKGDGDDSKTIS